MSLPMNLHFIAFVLGFLMDMLLGDPLGGFHIVVWMGKLISLLEKALRRIVPPSQNGERIAGTVLVLLVCLVSLTVSGGSLWLLYRIHPFLGVSLDTFFIWQCLAAKSLREESGKVFRTLTGEGLTQARQAVGRIVGRDTDALDEAGVIRACVETVAENTSDGVIAPMFYIIIGGAPLGVLYKAVNTMDSMLGYRNETYLYFGRTAAKADDMVNNIPARIAALLMVLSAFLCGYDGRNAMRIFRRDRYQHASPNSAQTESACAGALHIRLGGGASYFGKFVAKPTIGDDDRPVCPEDILRANRLMLCCDAIFFLLGVGIRGCMFLC